jgi:2-polyprenyl-6-hydroxyphenyl methylase/3-demethylubiquinone-9 3-methyltransferase
MEVLKTVDQAELEVKRGERFQFGKNWQRFLTILNDDRIAGAEKSLQQMLEIEHLQGKRFLDIGSGSGLFSLAARRLGAKVYSFDYDPDSVACTQELKCQFFPNDSSWIIEQGSVLDTDYIKSLGEFDIVYSWGVLHHTGAMWQALENASLPVSRRGFLFVAIYNQQGWISNYWKKVKEFYNKNIGLRLITILVHLPYLFLLRFLVRAITGRLKNERGMSIWFDMLDWLGGYPFEVAKPEEICIFYRRQGFQLLNLKTCAGKQGCNEFVFFKENG